MCMKSALIGASGLARKCVLSSSEKVMRRLRSSQSAVSCG